jgi:hypothetical protein
VARQAFPCRLPVRLRARPEARHVEGGHIRGNP